MSFCSFLFIYLFPSFCREMDDQIQANLPDEVEVSGDNFFSVFEGIQEQEINFPSPLEGEIHVFLHRETYFPKQST